MQYNKRRRVTRFSLAEGLKDGQDSHRARISSIDTGDWRVILPAMRMRLAVFLKVSILFVAWLVFGGAYVLDVLDRSYEMNNVGTAYEQGLESEDKAQLLGLSIAHANDSVPMVFCLCLHTGTYAQPHARLFHISPTRPLHQRLSVYRI
jgi:hypothetical protein